MPVLVVLAVSCCDRVSLNRLLSRQDRTLQDGDAARHRLPVRVDPVCGGPDTLVVEAMPMPGRPDVPLRHALEKQLQRGPGLRTENVWAGSGQRRFRVLRHPSGLHWRRRCRTIAGRRALVRAEPAVDLRPCPLTDRDAVVQTDVNACDLTEHLVVRQRLWLEGVDPKSLNVSGSVEHGQMDFCPSPAVRLLKHDRQSHGHAIRAIRVIVPFPVQALGNDCHGWLVR